MTIKRLKGQALIIGLLFVVVVSTIVLALISRSLKDVKISTESQKELRSFSAAEAGLEKVLNNPQAFLTQGETQINVGNVNVSVITKKAQWNKYIVFTFPDGLAQDDVRQFFLVQYDDSNHSLDESKYYNVGSIDLLWGRVKSNGAPAENQPGIEVTFYYKDGDQIKSKRYAFDAQGRGNFSTNVQSVGSTTYRTTFGKKRFAYRATINFGLNSISFGSRFASVKTPLFLRVRFLFNGQVRHPLGFAVPSDKTGDYYYPTQGYKITSQAGGEAANSSVQRLEAFKSFPILPAIFDYALYSGTSLEVD